MSQEDGDEGEVLVASSPCQRFEDCGHQHILKPLATASLCWIVGFGIEEIQSNEASGTGPNCVVGPCQREYPQLPRPLGL